jgi:hypothetical protein
MSAEGVAAIASLIAAVGGVGSAIAAIIAAVNASGSRKVAGEARDLVRQVITNQQTNIQTNAQQQNFHFHGPTTVGNVATPPPQELVFPAEAVPATPAALPAPEVQPPGLKAEPAP